MGNGLRVVSTEKYKVKHSNITHPHLKTYPVSCSSGFRRLRLMFRLFLPPLRYLLIFFSREQILVLSENVHTDKRPLHKTRVNCHPSVHANPAAPYR